MVHNQRCLARDVYRIVHIGREVLSSCYARTRIVWLLFHHSWCLKVSKDKLSELSLIEGDVRILAVGYREMPDIEGTVVVHVFLQG